MARAGADLLFSGHAVGVGEALRRFDAEVLSASLAALKSVKPRIFQAVC